MTKKLVVLLCGFFFLFVNAQKDTIDIDAQLVAGILTVNQSITYHNISGKTIHQIKLLNWVSAYQKRETPLLKRKLEDRKTDLYFAKNEDLGELIDLSIENYNQNFDQNSENIFLKLNEPLENGKKISLKLRYSIKLPDAKFTGYGKSKEHISLKYFFIVPDSFDAENTTEKYFLDIEENENIGNFWHVKFANSAYKVQSNLYKISENTFEGMLNKDVEFYISNQANEIFNFDIDGEKHQIELGYSLSESEKTHLEFYLPLQLKFFKQKIGFLPQKIFINSKSKEKNDFVGNDDIKFWKFKFQLFSDAEKVDLDYISIISQEIMELALKSDKNENHWIINGLKTYLEMQYLQMFYKNYKLLGNLPETSVFKIKPLKIFHASQLKIMDRYGLAYQYIMSQNLDQKIDEKYENLSNFNQFAISKFEAGSIFNFLSEKVGKENFENFLKNFISNNEGQFLDGKMFLDELSKSTNYSSEFLEKFVQHKNRVNFNLKSFKRKQNNFEIKVCKNSQENIPFKLETEKNSEDKNTFWYDTSSKENPYNYVVPDAEAKKITINDGFAFPESNFRDNYLYTKGFFSNTKKLKLKFFKDIPNPEFNEVYINPSLKFNAYDQFLIGLSFRNQSLIDRKFNYSFSPFFSTGTNQFTGSAGISYRFQPVEKWYRSLSLGVSGANFHYDKDLSYRKFSSGISLGFSHDVRSEKNSSIGFSYNYFEKDMTEKMILNNEYEKYNLWNLGYGYSNRQPIHEKYGSVNLQWMEDFQKISGEAFYRWEFAQNKKISFRFFAGYFITNTTRNSTFDIGISRLSNYSFSYNLLGQSASSGILSQQYILADGGFKTFFRGTANNFLTSFNVDSHVWKMFNVYADAGFYQNKFQNGKFIWDSGIKLKLLPEFIEIYFPVQSSLGFEPSFRDYGYRIRYTLILNFGSLVNQLRRGWF